MKKGRKDYIKKRNIKNNNLPTPRYIEEKNVYEPIRKTKAGYIGGQQIGVKTIERKGVKPILRQRDNILPKSRKIIN